MKAVVRLDGGEKVEIRRGIVVVSSSDQSKHDFSFWALDLEVPGVKAMHLFPRDFRFEVEQEDGWVFSIRRGIHEKDHLVVIRFKRDPTMTIEEYLTREGKWLSSPKGYGPYPPDAMKIPLPVPAEVGVPT